MTWHRVGVYSPDISSAYITENLAFLGIKGTFSNFIFLVQNSAMACKTIRCDNQSQGYKKKPYRIHSTIRNIDDHCVSTS